MTSELLKSFEEKQISKDILYAKVVENFGLLPEVLKGVDSSKASVRYGCSKVLTSLSANYPKQLYPYIDEFFTRLESKHRILVWNTLATIANLATVDSDKKIDAQFERICSFMNNEYMITVANSIGSLGKIAQTKPYLIPQTTTELLRIENLTTTPHLTEECKLVLAERTLKALDEFGSKIDDEEKFRMLSFAKRCKNSKRKSLSNKAELFLKKWGKN